MAQHPRTPAALLAAVAASDDTARRLTADLPEASLHVVPPAGGWTIAQVFEHLLVSHGLYVDRVGPAIAAVRKVPAERAPPARPWKPTLFGRMLIAAVGPDFRPRLPTARVFEPGPVPRPHVFEAFLQMQQEIARLLREGADLDWRSVRLSSPVNRLIRLNLGDAYVILVIHTQRHLNQVARIRAALL